MEIKQKIENSLLAVAIIGFVIAILLGLVFEVKHSMRMEIFAEANGCSWQYYGDVPGNDKGYICK